MFRDYETLKAAIEAAKMLGAQSAREAAAKTLRRGITDQEWSVAGERWERAWRDCAGSNRAGGIQIPEHSEGRSTRSSVE